MDRQPASTTTPAGLGASAPSRSRVVGAGFALLVLLGIALRVSKAHATGIVFDEALSFFEFGTFERALTSYRLPNNHVLNSILMGWADALVPWEHAIRLPALVFGALFVVALASLARRTIACGPLALAAFAAITFNAFVFDLTFLARGYALALGAAYAFLAWWLRWNERDGSIAALVAATVALNVVALASMLSSLALVASIDLCVLVALARGGRASAKAVVSATAVVLVASAGLLFLVYFRLWDELVAIRKSWGKTGLRAYLRQILVEPFVEASSLASILTHAFLVLSAGCALVLVPLARLRRVRASNGGGAAPQVGTRRASGLERDPLVLLGAVTAATFVAMVVGAELFDLSYGWPRNGVFVVPVTLLVAFGLLDRLAHLAGGGRRLLQATFIAATAALGLWNLPSPTVTEIGNFAGHSVSGPLVRELHRLDPDRHWTIWITDSSRFTNLPIAFYAHAGYPVTGTADPRTPHDVAISFRVAKDARRTYFREDLFDRFETLVLVRER